MWRLYREQRRLLIIFLLDNFLSWTDCAKFEFRILVAEISCKKWQTLYWPTCYHRPLMWQSVSQSVWSILADLPANYLIRRCPGRTISSSPATGQGRPGTRRRPDNLMKLWQRETETAGPESVGWQHSSWTQQRTPQSVSSLRSGQVRSGRTRKYLYKDRNRQTWFSIYRWWRQKRQVRPSVLYFKASLGRGRGGQYIVCRWVLLGQLASERETDWLVAITDFSPYHFTLPRTPGHFVEILCTIRLETRLTSWNIFRLIFKLYANSNHPLQI